MKLTNQQIFAYANLLTQAFKDSEQRLPVKINFYLQKNKNILIELAQDIEKTRMEIAEANGKLDSEKGQYTINPENIEIVQKELTDLFNLEQDVDIYTIDIDSLGDDLTLTTGQMEALMFMIN